MAERHLRHVKSKINSVPSSNVGLRRTGANISAWLVLLLGIFFSYDYRRWTRGTGPTNIVTHELESYGVRTFSAKEMAFNILGLMHPLLFSITRIWADLNGGMDKLHDLADITGHIRSDSDLMKKGELRCAITLDYSADFQVINGVEAERLLQTVDVTPRANFRFDFPTLEAHNSFADLSKLQGRIDLDKVMVITGYGEVGPWGRSRTRWEMEARGEFTIQGCIERAWLMGYLKHFDGRLKDGSLYVGWADGKSGEPVDDKDVKGRYQKDILEHAEPELFRALPWLRPAQEVEVTESEAKKFKLRHAEKCDIWAGEGDQGFFKLKKGALVFVPKSFYFNRTVAGQILTGWHAGRYGIPEDIIAQVDRGSLWALVSTAEALNASGITDPYELYKHMHPSEVGTCLGRKGGTISMGKMFKDRRDERDVPNDILQETFINTTAGWINLLLMSSEWTRQDSRRRLVMQPLCEEGSFEFANMKATSSAESEFAMGREPTEISRPATTTRAGAQGTGVHIVMSAKTALELSCPIRGVLTFTSTSTDKAGRSIPAPGLGPLTVAREVPSQHPLPIPDLAYRARQLAFRRKQISQRLTHEHAQLQEVELLKAQGDTVDDEFFGARVANIEQEAAQPERDAFKLAMYGMLEGTDPRVSPLRRALAVWGLTADDIGVLSIHGTSTKANEENETRIWNDIFTSLARTPGNAVPIMAQKSLLGHSKGGSAAWQMAGLRQTVNSGVVPGNRNADNIDSHFRRYLLFPSKPVHTDGSHSALVSCPHSDLAKSVVRHEVRAQQSHKAMSEMMIKHLLVRVKEAPPYSTRWRAQVWISRPTRTSSQSLRPLSQLTPPTSLPSPRASPLLQLPASLELVLTKSSSLLYHPPTRPSSRATLLMRRSLTAEYSPRLPPHSLLAGPARKPCSSRWGVASKGAGAAMQDIEIVNDEQTDAPVVRLYGEAKAAADKKGVGKVMILLSHSETVAIAIAQATAS
ncbi:Fatty acid synthase [Mycena indigotica]|uniref:beta-ketoacyl-[acyl-carrier-protein] synthase I n=1 Tax=Mycena indigotica TaxID=2126181 RepID=A0A8H6T6C0_9AGAR|nr:Fatty acid synthase [Mycena indigotica]KAF7311700.1 Fatty acid synthase [Mycena indigotica]